MNAMIKQPMPFSDDIEHDPIHLAAADWFVRLQSTEVSLEETLAWQAWLHENPLHAQAFARIEEISDVMRHIAAPPAASMRELARDRYDASVPIKNWKRRVCAVDRGWRWAWRLRLPPPH